MQKKIIKIAGLHCPACEILTADKLREIPELRDVRVNWREGTAEIFSDSPLSESLIASKIKSAGYKVVDDNKLEKISRDSQIYKDVALSILIIGVLYFILKALGLFDISVDYTNLSWPLVIVVGLVAGCSSCLALVGGLALSLSARYSLANPEATTLQKIKPQFLFNAGRLLTYALGGGLLGLFGSAIKLSFLTAAILTTIVGLIMLIMGLDLTGLFPGLDKFKFALPSRFGKNLNLAKNNKKFNISAFLSGAITFFLPCGFTQAMQVYALSSGSFITGALIMFLFALGTLPGILGLASLATIIKGLWTKRFFRFAGVLIIIFSLFSLSNAYRLGSLSLSALKTEVSATIDSSDTGNQEVQTVNMDENSSGYSPNVLEIKKGQHIKWVINAQAPYSCASTIIVPDLNISKTLQAGENIIEFTAPNTVGRLRFSCSMGMYSGYFNVTD